MSARSLLTTSWEVAVVVAGAGKGEVEAGGLRRRLDPGVTAFGLFPLLLTRSPLLFDAPPKANKAPSSAALGVVSLLLAVDGTRDGDLCARDIAADWKRQSLASYSEADQVKLWSSAGQVAGNTVRLVSLLTLVRGYS